MKTIYRIWKCDQSGNKEQLVSKTDNKMDADACVVELTGLNPKTLYTIDVIEEE